MLVWLLKLALLSLNIRASHKALAPSKASRARNETGRHGSNGSARGERARRKQVREEVVNWIVWIAFVTAEGFADRSIGRILPLYGTAKVVILLLLLVLRGPGSQQVYDKLLAPLIRPYERPLDLAGFVANECLDVAIAVLLFLPRKAALKWKARQQAHDIPSILKGLRQPHHPQLAKSLADSIERSQGDSDTISARFSEPVRARPHSAPFRPSRSVAPASRSEHLRGSSAQSRPAPMGHRPIINADLPPPPVASAAPFRPVPIVGVPATHSTARAGTSGTQLPRATPPGGRRGPSLLSGPAEPPSSSIYPSLASVSTPLTAHSSAPGPGATMSTASAGSADRKARRSSTRTAVRDQSFPVDGEGNLDADSVRGQSRSPDSHVSERSRASTSRGRRQATPERREASQGAEAIVPGPANGVPPPTPAPPGAFSFSTPASLSVLRARRLAEEDVDEDVQMDDAERTPLRRSARKSAGTPTNDTGGRTSSRKRPSAPASDLDSVAEGSTPERKPTPRKRRSAAGSSTTKDGTSHRRIGDEAVGTPRQKALGAIAQLSKDLLDAGEGADDRLGLSRGARRRTGSSLLSQSVRGGEVRRVGTRRTARGKDALDEAQRSETSAAARGEDGPAKVSPRKRKAANATTTAAQEASEGSDAPPAKKVASGTRATTGPSRALPTTTGATARSSGLPVRAEANRVTKETDQERSAASTAKPASAPPVNPPERGPTPAGLHFGPRPPNAAPRRARRVLLGRAGPTAAEEEEEIDGVQVVRRSRRKA